jgi:iron(III) transport system permease protein
LFQLSSWGLWRTTLLYAVGGSGLAVALGVSSAWLIARTNAWFQRTALFSAYLSLAAPVMIKTIGWILLLGPNTGLLNLWLRGLFGLRESPIQIFTLGGMIAFEGIFWFPVVLILATPILSQINPALEEAAAVAGANPLQRFFRIAVPLAAPGLLAVLFLTMMRALESFEVPLLIGGPGNLQTFTTAIYETINSGFLPRYGDASAYAVTLTVLMAAPLFVYAHIVRQGTRYAVVIGKGYRSTRLDLGKWRVAAGLYLLLPPLALLAPLAILLWASFLPTYATPSWSDLSRMSLENYRYVLTRPLTVGGFWNGIWVATLSATGVAAFALLAAWTVVRRRERSRWLLDALGSFPLVFPGIVLATALTLEFLTVRAIPIYETVWIMILAFFIQYLPYGMRFGYAGILAIDLQLEESAVASGAKLFTLLRRIVLPLVLPSVAMIWIYVFLHSIRDLAVPVMLAGPNSQLIAGVILDLWNDGSIPQVGALSVLLAVAVTCFGVFLMRLGRGLGPATL